MANQGMDIGLVYGKARYRKLSISAGDENITALRATLGRKQVAVRYPEELVVATEISPGTKITIAADIKEKEVDSSNKMYHDGNVPKQGNYYFSNQSTYTFDEWKDVRNGITLKTAVADGSSEYSFKMPMVDMIIEGKSKTSIAEVDKVYARELKVINGASGSSSGKWPISSVSIKQGSTTKASGVTDASAYFWESPTDVLTIQATLPGTETGDTLQYLSGEAPSKGNMKWYVRTDYYVTRVAASDGMNKATDVKTSNIHLTRDMSYSFYGTSSTARTEVVNALSADVTVQETVMGGGVTQSRTTWYDRWYWADTGHGELTRSRAGDIQRSISIKEDNQKNRYTSEYLNDKRNMILINEYGRIKKSAESVPNNDPSVTYISETYSGWFTKTSRDQVNYAQSFYTSGDNRGEISTIHTKEYSSYYSWEGVNPNRCGLVNGGNYGESMTSSDGSFTRIHMYSGNITYRGHNYEWHITRDYNLTFNANNSSGPINNFVKNLGSTKQLANTGLVFTSSSLRSDNNQQTWVNTVIGAKANWAQYVVTRIDQHWGFRDNENPYYSTTFTFKSKSVATKKSTWRDGNGVTQSKSYYNYTTWQQWINDEPGITFTRNQFNFPFRWYSATRATCMDYANANTVGLKSSDKTVQKTRSTRGYFSVAANFFRQSMTWTYPECNAAHPDGLFKSFAKSSDSKVQTFHSVAHLTMPYIGNIGQYKALKIKSTCEFMQNETGYKSVGLYFEQPMINTIYEVVDETKLATAVQSIPINSTLYKNQYAANAAYGSANVPCKVISNSTFGYQNYTMMNPNIAHISQLSTPNVKGRGDNNYVYYTFNSHVRMNDRVMSVLSTVNGVAKTAAIGNGAYRIPEIYTVSMPSAFADINKSSFKRSELGELYKNATSGCWPQNFTFGVIRFSSSNIIHSIKASSVTQTASSFYFGRAHYNTPDGILQCYNNYVLSKISWNNVQPLRHDVEVDLYGELHAITFTTTFEYDYFTQTFLYESGHYTNGDEEIRDYSINNITKPLSVNEVVEEKVISYIPPSSYSDEDAEDVFDDVSEDDFVPGDPDPNAD